MAGIKQKEISKGNLFVGLPGLEPGKAGPESAVLPLHHSPMLKCDAKVQLFFDKKIFSPIFCLKKRKNFLFSALSTKKPMLLF